MQSMIAPKLKHTRIQMGDRWWAPTVRARRDRRHRIRYSTSTDSRQTDPASSLCRLPSAVLLASPEPSSNPAVVHYRYLRYKGKAAKAAELERVKGVEFART